MAGGKEGVVESQQTWNQGQKCKKKLKLNTKTSIQFQSDLEHFTKFLHNCAK